MWLEDLLMSKTHIENYSIEICISYLGTNEIDISDYILVTMGKDSDQQRRVGFLRIYPNLTASKPLQGKQTICIYGRDYPINMEVDSLSPIRQTIFGFTDHLSFERGTFLCLPNHQVIIRLKCVRGLMKGSMLKKHACNSGDSPPTSIVHTSRTRSQFVKNIEQIYTSYLRDFQYSSNFTRKEILEILRKDLDNYLNEISVFV